MRGATMTPFRVLFRYYFRRNHGRSFFLAFGALTVLVTAIFVQREKSSDLVFALISMVGGIGVLFAPIFWAEPRRNEVAIKLIASGNAILRARAAAALVQTLGVGVPLLVAGLAAWGQLRFLPYAIGAFALPLVLFAFVFVAAAKFRLGKQDGDPIEKFELQDNAAMPAPPPRGEGDDDDDVEAQEEWPNKAALDAIASSRNTGAASVGTTAGSLRRARLALRLCGWSFRFSILFCILFLTCGLFYSLDKIESWFWFMLGAVFAYNFLFVRDLWNFHLDGSARSAAFHLLSAPWVIGFIAFVRLAASTAHWRAVIISSLLVSSLLVVVFIAFPPWRRVRDWLVRYYLVRAITSVLTFVGGGIVSKWAFSRLSAGANLPLAIVPTSSSSARRGATCSTMRRRTGGSGSRCARSRACSFTARRCAGSS